MNLFSLFVSYILTCSSPSSLLFSSFFFGLFYSSFFSLVFFFFLLRFLSFRPFEIRYTFFRRCAYSSTDSHLSYCLSYLRWWLSYTQWSLRWWQHHRWRWMRWQLFAYRAGQCLHRRRCGPFGAVRQGMPADQWKWLRTFSRCGLWNYSWRLRHLKGECIDSFSLCISLSLFSAFFVHCPRFRSLSLFCFFFRRSASLLSFFYALGEFAFWLFTCFQFPLFVL